MPNQPFPIDGTTKDDRGIAIEGLTIEIYNLKNGNLIKKDNATDSDGVYIIDLENHSNFNWSSNDRIIIRAYRIGGIFKFGEIRATLTGDALENQNIIVFDENPPSAKDLDDRKFQQAEHHPTANAKKIILVNQQGDLDGDPLDRYQPTDEDFDNDPNYTSFTDIFGGWYIVEDNFSDGTHRYAKGSSDYTSNWDSRTSLEYDYFYNVFQ